MANNDKPQTEAEYVVWARENQCGDFNDAVRRQYHANQTVVAQTVNNHSFFSGLDRFLNETAREYFDKEGFYLLLEPNATEFKLITKSYASTLDKIFRLNVIRNHDFPNEPKDGWVTPENMFSLLDDILRGTIVCKYIDGPGILSKLLVKYATDHGLHSFYVTRQLDRGYYAYHYYVEIPVEINDLHYKPVEANLTVEIQLTT